ncbi:hypothetical protein TSOC_009896 [Tetrabaena socialis]|uniref:Uncharacterized protein n=1 Tax=Tetrabaena socialis TaxID=47790 RepID=A0A2J7ZUS3_9CHLO|nr:hypothetical protein TSOC_009896 [Tetrabaena socialis]|eukprot:PNH03999.1 hypothetical protein TSOC_009896 [Tetrabaena socialis]
MLPPGPQPPWDLDRVGLGTSTLDVRVVSSISKVSREEWDAVVSDAEVNPFLLHDFLLALEDSGSAAPRAGWLAQHVLVYQVGPGEEAGASADGTAAAAAGPSGAPAGRLVGCVPMYLKSHSYGEYVFDSSWANYAEMLGIRYYPKLQAAVPFTPVTGPRLMVSGQLGAADRTAVVKAMGQALIRLADSTNVSGLHVTFSTAQEWAVLAELGFKQRLGIQFHFDNDGYSSFDAFLADLKQSRRKSIRQERKSVAKAGLLVHRLSGTSLTPDHWDRFYSFYLNTCDKKWGNAYLTRDFFQQLGQRLPERVLLVGATEGVHEGAGPVPVPKARELVAGALNLVGSHALYGRNWGCAEGSDVKNLHFELCYYQAQEEAISRGLPRVEAGAQGEHKLQRGYLPSFTYSCHYIRDPRLGYAVDKFLDRERRQIEYTLQVMSLESSPFKKEKTVESLMSKLRAYSILSSGGSSGSSWEVEEEVQEDGE